MNCKDCGNCGCIKVGMDLNVTCVLFVPMPDPKFELLSVYDEIETYTDCTVQVLTNSVTGNQSVGWWRNDKPPTEIKWEESK